MPGWRNDSRSFAERLGERLGKRVRSLGDTLACLGVEGVQLDSSFADGQIVAGIFGPAAAVEIVDVLGVLADRVVRVAAARGGALLLAGVGGRLLLELAGCAEQWFSRSSGTERLVITSDDVLTADGITETIRETVIRPLVTQ
jgi:hypothetical protein